MATPPMNRVETVGVLNLRWIFANSVGSARYTPIASVPRAAGRIVVWVDAAADTRTASSTIQLQSPRTGSLIVRKTSPALSSLPSPMPSAPTPAYEIAAPVGSIDVARRQ